MKVVLACMGVSAVVLMLLMVAVAIDTSINRMGQYNTLCGDSCGKNAPQCYFPYADMTHDGLRRALWSLCHGGPCEAFCEEKGIRPL